MEEDNKDVEAEALLEKEFLTEEEWERYKEIYRTSENIIEGRQLRCECGQTYMVYISITEGFGEIDEQSAGVVFVKETKV